MSNGQIEDSKTFIYIEKVVHSGKVYKELKTGRFGTYIHTEYYKELGIFHIHRRK